MRIIFLIILLSLSSLCHAGIWWGSPGDVSDVKISFKPEDGAIFKDGKFCIFYNETTSGIFAYVMAKINGQWVRVYEPLLWDFTSDDFFIQPDGSLFFSGGDITGGVRIIYNGVTSDWYDIEAYETPSEYHDTNILVCYNTIDLGIMGNGESKAIADYYKIFRPDCHFLPLAITTEMCHNATGHWRETLNWHMHDEVIYPEFYESQIRAPIDSYLSMHPEIHFIVLCKGIPFSIHQDGGWNISSKYNGAKDQSLASRLCKVHEEITGISGKFNYPPINWPLHKGMRFRNDLYKINYIVSWLSGWSILDITNKINLAFSVKQDKWNEYMWVLDLQDFGGYWYSDSIMNGIANATEIRLSQIVNPENIIIEDSRTNQLKLITARPVIGYASVGTYEQSYSGDWIRDTLGFPVAPGALLVSVESYNAVHSTEFLKNIYWGYMFQGLIYDSFFDDVGRGANYEHAFSGASGHVREPGTLMARPQVFMPAYALGFTAAEAFQMSLLSTSPSIIVLGDPLMRIR